jgi:hypothetical protein
MRGDPFFVETSEGDSKDLLIFLQSGGVCLEEICAATVAPTLNFRLLLTGDLVGIGGVLDRSDERNPLRHADIVHVPYCDGSIFAGDVDRILSDGDPDNGTEDMAYQRGLLNLTAALEVAKATFPNPSRVILAGTSGGSYGTVIGVALTRYYYPDDEIVVIADSGAPILRDHDPAFVRRTLDELNASQYVPQSCPDCLANGHVTKVIEWALDRDPNMRLGLMTHAHDRVIGEFFMQSLPEDFAAAWVRESSRLAERYPGRIARFIGPGDAHTYLLDVDAVGSFLQQTVLYLFGSLVFTGDSVMATELANWTLGGLSEEVDGPGSSTVTGYEWLTAYLDGPAAQFDVVQTE